MKIFGLEISLNKKREDVVSLSVVRSPDHIPISKIPTVKVAPLVYAQQFARINRGVFFLAPEYDLAEIGKIEDTDSYVRWSFRKKEGLMFKEGVQVRGRNKHTIQYYKTRMAQIAQASGIPTVSLMKRVARSLIRTSNAYLVKVRSTKASGGQVRKTADGKTLQPVAAYFPAAPEMFKMDLDPESGKIRHWRQQLPNGWYKLFKPEDVVHFTFDKREGFSYGVPALVPVIDDIRALRQIEENIELLLYQHLFPLFHYKVGTLEAPAAYTETGKSEIEAVQEQVKLMPAEGMIVTPERHEITAIGTEGRAMNAEGYLKYFKERVFAGLGMSGIDFGITDTSNRATANVASRALVDSVKAFQDDFESQWDQHIIRELLLESTFGDDVLEEDNMVHLQFGEIDIDIKIKHEAHAAEMFKMNGITWDEFRNELGREPILVPEDPEDMDKDSWPEWFNTHWKLFDEPSMLIKAVDEPYLQTEAAIHNRSIGVTTEMGKIATQQSQAAMKAEVAAKAAAKPKPSVKAKKDSLLAESFNDFEKDFLGRTQQSIENRGRLDLEYLNSLGRSWTEDSLKKMSSLAVSYMIQGFNDQSGGRAYKAEIEIGSGRKLIQDRIYGLLNRLSRDVVSLVKNRVEQKIGSSVNRQSYSDLIEQIHIAFDSVRYRTHFIWDVELKKAYNYGRLLGMGIMGAYGGQIIAQEDSCERCKASHGRLVEVSAADLDEVPPFHANSRIGFEVLYPSIEDEEKFRGIPEREPGKPAVEQDNPSAKEKSAVCPKCGKTALWQPKSLTYHCMACKNTFQKIKDDLNVGGAGAIPSRKPKIPAVEQPNIAFSPSARLCPRCGYKGTLLKKEGNFQCSRCNYIFSPKERPQKVTPGRAVTSGPQKERKNQAKLPSSVGGPAQYNSVSEDADLVNSDKLHNSSLKKE